MRALLCVLSAVLAVCSAPTQGSVSPSISWATFQKGQYSELPRERQFVVNSLAEWQAAWPTLSGNPPATAPRGVDWGREMVVVIQLGQKTSGGFDVHVENVRRVSAATISIDYVETQPPRGAMVTQQLTAPWVAIRMVRQSGNLVFSRRAVIGTEPPRPGGRRCSCGCGCRHCGAVLVQTQVVLPDAGMIARLPGQAISWRTFQEGSSATGGSGTFIINNEAEWQMRWRQLTGQPPQNAPGGVKFGEEMLVAIQLGPASPQVDKVYVESVSRTRAAEVTVSYVVLNRPPTRPTGAQSTRNPFVVIRMKRPGAGIQFRRREITPRVVAPQRCTCGCPYCN